MKEKTLVFDIGSVLVDLDMEDVMDGQGIEEEARAAIRRVGRIDGLWDSLDRGDLELMRGAELFAERVPGFEEQAMDVFLHMTDYITAIEENVSVLRRAAAKGIDCRYLSNFQRENWATMWRKLDFFPLFRGGVVSWRVRHIKPEREIYERFLEECGLAAADCIFIDDRPVNTRAAQELGFTTVTAAPGVDLAAQLAALGVAL